MGASLLLASAALTVVKAELIVWSLGFVVAYLAVRCP
jgi:hypothetical protein